ncbi:MAG TPA: acetyl-CoA carboxylase biotin carboxyl carrier protein [Chitinophagales bacterium]|jgi:acetyl-CoA carboxylase biotin carboxyl carrier protein|nr:acetyl-CoA carboxylase biotin carboxyl carrier protein [Chitinophagales bacterium]HQW79515.1 acetyl-CoA carboxylase biotin carboxyl carrier protein [Chitinophagales bacterium]HRB67698.1 acetyl-CoA carboxylase biotin carboxyl carrier protein [Chitinophagales bacterium]HRB69277.1 acetyl-CoA carboxylase biotin carboxyl carrier protein [Chitinophagales bacterium]HRB92773.1 acetyl-CoA carboxylase biotin carboxyl carrier protein [Chitinophagales bacterium]
MDIAQIKKLIQLLNDNHLGELKVQDGDFKITIRHKDFAKSSTATSVITAPASSIATLDNSLIPANSPSSKNEGDVLTHFQTIKAPMIGTFYRAAGEGKEPFVKVGDKVKKGDVLCIIEAMKLFNEIQSEISGKVIKVMVDNAQAVEYDQPLFLIEP